MSLRNFWSVTAVVTTALGLALVRPDMIQSALSNLLGAIIAAVAPLLPPLLQLCFLIVILIYAIKLITRGK